jgi:hypothetical protein
VLVDYATLTLYLLTFLVLLFKRISAYCRARERKTFSG